MKMPFGKNQLGDRKILKDIFWMGIPSAISFMSVNLYDFINALWVSRLGPAYVAAITMFFGFYWVISSVNQLAGAGSISIISQNYGNGDFARTEAAIKETYILKWVSAIIFGILGLLFLDDILIFLGASRELIGDSQQSVLSLAHDYGVIQLLGMGFSFCAFTHYTALRGIGNPNLAMILMLSSVALNIILDPFLIYGWWIFPRLGIRGAAIASVIANAASFFAGLILFYSGAANVRLHFRGKIRVKISSMFKILKIGAPSGVNAVAFSLSRSIVLAFVATTTSEAVAAYGIGMRVSALSVMAIVGLGLGLSALIGQMLGAEKPERAKSTAYHAMGLSLLITGVIAILTMLFAHPIMRAFFDPSKGIAETEVIAIGTKLLRIISISLPAVGIYIVIESVFSGAGNNMPPMVFTMITGFLLEIPMIVCALKLLKTEELGIWWALAISQIVGASLTYWWFTKGTWLKVRVKG